MDDRVFRGVVLGGVLVFAMVLLRLRFGYAFETPEPPPTTAEMYGDTPSIATPNRTQPEEDEGVSAYAEELANDSKKYSIRPVATVASTSRALRYAQDVEVRPLVPGAAPIEVLGLKLSASVKDLKNTAFQQYELTIENMRSKAVAYRIRTKPSVNPKVCYRKQDQRHNAVALDRRAKITRSECVWRKGWSMELLSVEVIDLPSLGFAYVSAVPPARLGVDTRTGRGHRPDHSATRICNVVHSVSVEKAMENGEVTWRDLVDFYARHRCESYVFSATYRAFEGEGDLALPFNH